MTIKKSLCIGALALSLIGGCTNSSDSGKIIEKRYEPERIYVGKFLRSMGHKRNAFEYKRQVTDDEDFIIIFGNGKESRTVYVSKEVYDSLKEGDVFDTSKLLFEDYDIDYLKN